MSNNVTINRYRNYLEVVYYIHGEMYKIYIPLRVKQVLLASQCTISYVKQGKLTDIKQENDIPILITAEDLAADFIEVTNFNGDSKLYRNNEIVEYI